MQLPSRSIENKSLKIEYLTEGALRLNSLKLQGSSTNLLGAVPEIILPLGDSGYPILGGHRMWASPENPGWSFAAEADIPLEVETSSSHVRIMQQQPEAAGLRKSLTVTLEGDLPRLTIRHEMTNESKMPVAAAPWALTILPVGGTILLPLPKGGPKPGFQPQHNLAFWNYTTIGNLDMQYLEDCILLPTEGRTEPTKLGIYLQEGWCGYYNQSVFFKKLAPPSSPSSAYPDFGCSCEVYLANNFLELETLGPLQEIPPAGAAVHDETWELVQDLTADSDLAPYARRLKDFSTIKAQR